MNYQIKLDNILRPCYHVTNVKDILLGPEIFCQGDSRSSDQRRYNSKLAERREVISIDKGYRDKINPSWMVVISLPLREIWFSWFIGQAEWPKICYNSRGRRMGKGSDGRTRDSWQERTPGDVKADVWIRNKFAAYKSINSESWDKEKERWTREGIYNRS